MLAKALLPWFGGAAATWTVCLLFFQVMLLAGYAYAHVTRRGVHLAALALSLLAMPLSPKEPAIGEPAIAILAILALTVGAPYLVLASTSPLLQRWTSGSDPYRLYALSNLASLAGLAAYPFLIEPYLPLGRQLAVWSWLYVVFCICTAIVTWRAKEQAPLEISEPALRGAAVSWLALSGCGAGLLMATTNQMTQEIASIPLLWIVPLVIYLLTFIIVFERIEWYDRRYFALFASIQIPLACAFTAAGTRIPMWLHLITYSGALFATLMLLHGELALAKPERGALTRFYLAIAAGGALGGLLVAIVAPRLFPAYFEFPILLTAAAILSIWQRWRGGEYRGLRRLPPLARASLTGLAVAIVVPVLLLDSMVSDAVARSRNFYGVLKVRDWSDDEGSRRVLSHGMTTHGSQFLSQDRRLLPTTYYGKRSGAGIAIEGHPRRELGPLHVGLIGLGVGTLAAYSREGDVFRFYEINPEVTRLARKHFTFLARSEGGVEVIEGDARMRLRAEPPRGYDVLIVDAFSSDSIPVHLLTLECGHLYRRHLREDGTLAIHISNRTLDLAPVVRALARELGYSTQTIESEGDPSLGTYGATWMLLRRGQAPEGRSILWTDDFASILSVWKR